MTTAAQIIAKNRRGLVVRGFAPSDRQILELAARNPRASIAALGRMAGMARQNAWRAFKRLEAFGALARIGHLTVVQAKWIERLTVETAKERWAHLRKIKEQRKQERANRLKNLAEIAYVISLMTRNGTDKSKGVSEPHERALLERELEKQGRWAELAELWSE